jgi:glycosyltransferase involved in cell wall biosynthesis
MNNPDTANPSSEQTLEAALQKLKQRNPYQDYEFPKVTVIVPVYNCAQKMVSTLESILNQNYPDFEIVLVDAESTDRSLEIAKGYRDERIRIYTVSDNRTFAMLNKGISQAKGKYLNFLFPGDFYIQRETLKAMMTLALDHQFPALLFCGTLLRDGRSEIKLLYRSWNLELLRRGQQPSSLQAFWLRKDILGEIGNFNPYYSLRGGYEILCRLSLHRHMRVISTPHVFIDYDLKWVTWHLVLHHFWETLRAVWTYFGVRAAILWLFYQKDMKRFGKLWWRSLRIAFTGR